jgi:hypothetical protein
MQIQSAWPARETDRRLAIPTEGDTSGVGLQGRREVGQEMQSLNSPWKGQKRKPSQVYSGNGMLHVVLLQHCSGSGMNQRGRYKKKGRLEASSAALVEKSE